jgi:hypothetical protein
MNSTEWNNLTVFAIFLGREGVGRVTEDDEGLHMRILITALRC